MASFKNFIHSELTNLAQFLRARTTTVVFTIGFTFTLVVFAIVASVNSTENFPFTPYRPWHARIFSSPGNFSAILSLNFHRLAACPNVRCKNRTNIAGSLYYRPENTDVRLLKNFTAVSKRSSENDILQDSDRCDIFDGKWVVDNTYPSYLPGSCPYVDDAFNCFRNGRPDSGYQRLRWQPKGCHIPRLDGKDMLERLGGKRLVFVGDSLNRNMWQSMVCMLRNSLDDKSRVLDVSPKQHFRNEAFYAFRFVDFNSTVEYFRSPFLVQEWKMVNPTGTRKETLRLDMIQRSSSKYKDADIIVFNTGHWWTHEKTSRGKDYYQEGDHVYSKMKVAEAYSKALRTWAKWVESNVDSSRTRVFFRGYSASHFRGGRWNSGGNCDGETEPITNDTYVTEYPHKMNILESVIGEMKTPVFYLNVTRMTDYRKDAHPSVYRLPYNASNKRENIQDCSHWCLPGVPDAWNELLYTSLFFPGKDFRLTHR